MPDRLPPLTSLQYLVLGVLRGSDQPGRAVRDAMTRHGVRSSAPAFYQMMGRLEEGGLVEGWYDQKLVAGQNIKERRYRVTRAGTRAIGETRAFYLDRLAPARLAKRGSHA